MDEKEFLLELNKLMAAKRKQNQKELSELLRPYSLTSFHAFFMRELSCQGAMTLKQLSDSMGVNRASTSRAVADLSKKGFVRTDKEKEGQRKYRVSLTDSGREIENQIGCHYAKSQMKSLSRLTKDERKELVRLWRLFIEP